MALVKSQLANDLQAIFDDPPGDSSEAANLWGSAVGSYGSAVTPATVTGSDAQAALTGALVAAFADPNVDAAPAMETAFTAYGAAIGGGMAPAFVAVPPAGPVGWASLFENTTDNTSQAANDVADAVDTWMKTGTATPSAGGAPVNWS